MLHTKVDREYTSIIQLVQGIIEQAYIGGVSDIHIDPTEEDLQVRFRVDGLLKNSYSLPKKINGEVISRLKVMAQMRTDEHQVPQDGRFRVVIDDGYVDIRISIIPTYHGENAVLRLLIQRSEKVPLSGLGFSTRDSSKIISALKKPHGMILTTGPTGSGKTTTLYRLIELLQSPEVSIVTIEDPIEYSLTGIKQVQVNPRAGLTFANGLKSLLRQDPDVIMVGEIRDAETASIAVNSALTGHMVLTTLHTNDASSTMPRLFDMKIDPYLTASIVNLVIAQRLVRKICVNCKVKKGEVYIGNGCGECGMSGYKGRIGIYEVIETNEEIKNAIYMKATHKEIKSLAMKHGMVSMMDDGLLKVRQGITTLEEVLRVLND